jgi:hypothetical protein
VFAGPKNAQFVQVRIMCNVYGTHSWLNFSYLQWNEITTVAVSPLALQATFWQWNCIIYVDRRPTAPFLQSWLPAASLCTVTVARYGLFGCGKSKDWGCMGPACWVQYVDLGEGNLKEAEQNYVFGSIIICMGVQYTEAQLVEALRYKSLFPFPMVSLEFFIDMILLAAEWHCCRLCL